MKNIHSIQNELLLKEKALLVVSSMQEYNNDKEYFEYPRFRTFESGLYDKNFKAIFSLLKSKVKYFKSGYHVDNDNNTFLIIKLPKEKYFNARYLIVSNKLSYDIIYEKIFMILLIVSVLIFILSLYFLQTFAKPFKRINETLDSFIKDSIHEINTPLSIINFNIDLFIRKNGTNKYLQRTKAATKVLSNIYDDMDYLIKHETLHHTKELIELSSFLKERIEYFTEVASMKDIKILSDIKDTCNFEINPKQLQRVIDNTLSNAIKYSDESSEIEVMMYTKDNKCHMSFKDNGVGISNIYKVFTRYYRESKNSGGFGLGLNIVKSIIDEVGIELKIESRLRQGSRFLYIFPQNNNNSI
jgi:signal transduction histidine kinase